VSQRPTDPDARRLVEALLAAVGADQLRAIILFGSRLVQASPDRFSAYDLVVVCERYRPFYQALARAGATRRSPRLQSLLNRVLAPNVIAFAPDGWDGGPVAKIMVIEPRAFELAMDRRSSDHFVKGRLVQKVELLHARDERAVAWVAKLLRSALEDVPRWVGPFLESPFTAERAARRMLELSYAGEVRPEAADRVRDVFAAQREFLVASVGRALDEAVARRWLVRMEGTEPLYRFPRRRGVLARTRIRLYFLRSKARATARWLKHVVTFDNWLDYIARKVQRRTGMRIEITPWERRLPFLLLWPKVVRVLTQRPATLETSTGAPRESAPGDERP
jgi:hypothetical protein